MLQLYWSLKGKTKHKHENGLDYPHVESSNVTWNGVNCTHKNQPISVSHIADLRQFNYQLALRKQVHYMMNI